MVMDIRVMTMMIMVHVRVMRTQVKSRVMRIQQAMSREIVSLRVLCHRI